MDFPPPHRRWTRLVVLALLLWPGAVHAQDAVEEESGSIYFTLRGGWGLMHDSQFSRFSTFYTVEPDAEATFDSGATGSGAIGYRSSGQQAWRIEFEVAHWSNTFDSIQWNRYFKFGGYPTSGEIETVAYMVNWIGYLGGPAPHGDYRVFMGLGLGAAHFELKNVTDGDGPLFSDTDTSFAGQFLIGMEYGLTESLAVSLGYKLFGSLLATHADPGQPEIGGDRVRMPIATSSFLVGVSYYF